MDPVICIALSDAEPIWQELVNHHQPIMPFFSYAWYRTWVSVYTEWQPYILVVNNQTLAPFVRKGDLVQFAQMNTDFNDLIGPSQTAWSLILDFLKKDGVKKIELAHIVEGSATIDFFTDYLARHHNGTVEATETSPVLDLPASFEPYLESIKIKRKKYNKFLRECPDAVIKTSQEPEKDIEVLIDLMNEISFKQASFNLEKDALFKGITAACKESIWMQLLYLENRPIAAQMMFKDKEQVMLYISGYDREKYSNAGTYLIISAIKEAIENGFKQFSFLAGRKEYKYELGAKDLLLHDISVEL